MEFYIVDTGKEFKGTVQNTMCAPEPGQKLDNCIVHYTGGETFADYNKKNGGSLVAMTWQDFCEKYYNPWIKSIQKPFEEITQERFDDLLNCMPPKRWTYKGKDQFFFLGECYTASLYTCCVYVGGKYYSALRCLSTLDKDIFNLKNIE